MDEITELSEADLLMLIANRIKSLAFDIPPPNAHTPRLVELAIAIEAEAMRRLSIRLPPPNQ